MAYDRYDTRESHRDERSRWSNDRDRGNRGQQDDRGFFERAGDEIASWFGDDDAEHRRRQDHMHDERGGGDHRDQNRGHGQDRGRSYGQDRDYDRGYGRDYDRDRSRSQSGGSDRDRSNWNDNRGTFASGGSSERDYNPSWQRDLWGSGDRDGHERDRGNRDYRPMTGDYGRNNQYSDSEQFFAASGYGHGWNRDQNRDRDHDRSQTPYGRDEYRRTSYAGSREGSKGHDHDHDHDPHYSSWRDRHMGELDRDYDDYRREHQSKFENDFGSWREKRQQKRGVLGQVRDDMEVVGNDDKHVGTVDRVAGDRIILTKSDPDSGGAHHSLSCSDIDCVKDDKVVLDCSAEQAKQRWRNESRSRALFEREDQGEAGPHVLNRSFEGTYR